MNSQRLAVGAAGYSPGVPGGFNRYTGELLRSLLRRDEDLVVFSAARLSDPRARRVRFPGAGKSDFAGNFARLLWHQVALPHALRREGAAVYYSAVPEGMLWPVCPQVITIHDVLPLRYPEQSPRMQHYYRHVLPRLIDASAAVVTMSEATRCDVERYFAVGDRPVHVVYQGYRHDVFRPLPPEEIEEVGRRFGLQKYVLAVGEARPYKNLRGLITAWEGLRLPGYALVIVGRLNKMDPSVARYPSELGIQDRVRFLGYVPDEQLAALYGGAAAFVFPSLYEGFGIPPLEAMASGAAVIASHAASIPEVCGDAAFYIDPQDMDSIAAGIQRVISEPELAASLRLRGLERARRFSFDSAAGRIADILAACVA